MIYQVYDNWHRLAFLQDGNQRSRGVWSFIKYDVLNRVAFTGEVASALSRISLQSSVDGLTSDSKRFVTRSESNYTIDNNPGNVSISMDHALAVYYYDSYGFDRPSNDTPAGYAANPGGLATGKRTRVLGTNNWIRENA